MPAMAGAEIVITGVQPEAVLSATSDSTRLPTLMLDALGGMGRRFWYLNGRPIAATQIGRTTHHYLSKAGRYQLAVVDEGLLGITNYKTRNPHKQFYQREALGVLSWDIYDLLANSNAAAMNGMITLGGGDKGDEGVDNCRGLRGRRTSPRGHRNWGG